MEQAHHLYIQWIAFFETSPRERQFSRFMFAPKTCLYAHIWVEFNFSEHVLNMCKDTGLLLHTGDIKWTRNSLCFLADVSRLLGERITIQRVMFYTPTRCPTLCGIEALCLDIVAGRTSQRRICSPGTGGQQEVCRKCS